MRESIPFAYAELGLLPKDIEELSFEEYSLIIRGYKHKKKNKEIQDAFFLRHLSYFTYWIVSPNIKRGAKDKDGQPMSSETIFKGLGLPLMEKYYAEQREKHESDFINKFPQLRGKNLSS